MSGGLNIDVSGIAAIIAVIFVVIGLVLALFWFFKRSENLTDEDRANMERAKTLWIGATAVGVVAIFLSRMEKRRGHVRMSASRGASSSLL